MDPKFQDAISDLERKCALLLEMPPIEIADTKSIARIPGVYLISDNAKHLYAGRSNNIRRRLRYHGQGSPNQSPLAKQLAMIYLRRDDTSPIYEGQ